MVKNSFPRIILRRGKEESILRRHPWVFSGAIHSIVVSESDGRSSGDNLQEGEVVDVFSSSGEFVGRGHYGLGSIAVRLLTFEDCPLDLKWWTERLQCAWDVRRAEGLVGNPQTTCYRLVHGEGDGLSGLIIDVYATTAVIQCHSTGMYASRSLIVEALRAQIKVSEKKVSTEEFGKIVETLNA